ncbi:MAG: winged helix-turn-helix domain-containing protein, partial [Psychrosphaera sp.]|nr:winged helix-turn-helix domain-containing protein [Psychrosphaera sp.]
NTPMDEEPQLIRRFKMGTFEVFPDRNLLVRDEQQEKVAPKAMEVLMALIRRYPDTVSRKNIIATVWGDQPGADQLLSRVVANLRSHLHDTIRHPLYIETVAKKGYRMVAQVEFETVVEFEMDVEAKKAKKAIIPLHWFTLIASAIACFAVAVSAYLIGSTWSQPSQTGHLVQRSPFESSLQNESSPSLDPNSQFVVFARFDQQSSDLFIRRLSKNQASELVHSRRDNEFSPAVSPQGDEVAYFSVNSSGCTINVIDLISRTSRKVVDCGEEINNWITLEWSKDGKRLLSSRINPDSQLFEIVEYRVADGAVARTLSPASKRQSYSKPSYSPDEAQVVFAAYDTLDRSWLLNITQWNGTIQTLFKTSNHIVDIKWLGNRIYYSVLNSAKASGVWYFEPATGKSVQLTSTNTRFFDVSSDEKLLMTAEGASTINVWQYQLDSELLTEKTRITANRQFNHSPKRSPKGPQVSYVSNRSGNVNLWLTHSGEQSAQMISGFINGNIIDHSWASNGKSLLLSHINNNQYSVYSINATPDTASELGDPDTDKKFAVWLADQQHIAWNEKIDGQWQLVIFDSKTNTQQSIGELAVAQLLPGGKDEVLYVKEGGNELVRHNVVTNEVTTLKLSDSDSFDERQWTVVAPFVYLLAHEGEDTFLLQKRLYDGGLVKRWKIFDAIKPRSTFDIDDTNQRLLIPVIEELSSDLYLYRF